MEAKVILDKLGSLGISVRLADDRLQLEPGSKVPDDLLKVIKAHKQDIMAALKLKGYRQKYPDAEATTRLSEALAERGKELALRKSDLASPYYAGDEWTKTQICTLESHIAEIERCLAEGGSLKLPRCCVERNVVCLIAVQGFDECIMSPDGCGFSLDYRHLSR